MGSVFNRRTPRNPNWWVRFKDKEGKWQSVASGQPTKEQAKNFVKQIESNIKNGLVGIIKPQEKQGCAELISKWLDGLINRNARDDRRRTEKHLLPIFGRMSISDINLPSIMHWIDQQRSTGQLAEASVRHHLNLLSRFFSWAIERGHTTTNPVRQIPTGRRPQATQKSDVPYLSDEDLIRRILSRLPDPFHLMFYLGNRSGLRTGEISGLRLSDLSFLDEGTIRARFSYEGALKEDKKNTGKAKFVPAPDDAKAWLVPWVEKRKEEGAAPEDLLFPCPTRKGRPYRKELIEARWDELRKELGLTLTWYEATRHSFVSRNLEQGVSLDEVSAAVGHSSPVVTQRYYNHFKRRSFSGQIRKGLGLGEVKQKKRTKDSEPK
jgi:integrase